MTILLRTRIGQYIKRLKQQFEDHALQQSQAIQRNSTVKLARVMIMEMTSKTMTTRMTRIMMKMRILVMKKMMQRRDRRIQDQKVTVAEAMVVITVNKEALQRASVKTKADVEVEAILELHKALSEFEAEAIESETEEEVL